MTTPKSFIDFNLNENLIASLNKAGFENATPIQDMTIGPILEGKDIFAQAETGSGKTGSFTIPVLELILRKASTEEEICKAPQYVVLSPTRELAQQTHKVFSQFGKDLGIKSVCIIGGEDIKKQESALVGGARVLVATPGRLSDIVKQKIVDLSKCKGFIFDEADRLFDMGFKKDIEFALNNVAKDRQLIMVSATSNLDVLNTAYKFHSQPLELKLNEDSLLVDHIDHQIAMISKDEKMAFLVNQLRAKEDAYAIVFCNTQYQTHSVAEWLKAMKFKAKPISGRLAQNKRTRLMEEFRNKEVTILVCTDVAARGLDIKDVNFVVNYDIPQEAANYVHRIGRTGRAGKAGSAISFCAFEDCEYLDPIYELIQSTIPKVDIEESDFATDLCKRPYIDSKTLQVSERPGAKKPRTKTEKPKYEKRERKKRPESEVSARANMPRIDKRVFEIISSNKLMADKEAMAFLGLSDEHLLGHKVLEQGRKKYFLFGERKNKYKYFIKPIYKRILTPFLIDVIKKAKLNLTVRVSFKEPYLRVNFSGKDEKMLLRNENELLFAFDHIVRRYLNQRIMVPRSLKYSVRCFKDSKNQEKAIIEHVKKMMPKVSKETPILLKSMSPMERRIVHQFISENKGYKTTSIGDGKYKKVELSLS
jgi:superfamily II DNA/RNA helicase